jgi:hypothetical protein
MQIDFIYNVCLKKIMSPLLDHPEKQFPIVFMTLPPYLFAATLEINNGRSLNRLIHGLFHIALVISPRLVSSLGADIKVSC